MYSNRAFDKTCSKVTEAQKAEFGEKVEKGLMKAVKSAALFPVWLIFKAFALFFYVLGTVAGFIRFAIYIACGLLILGALVGAGWETFWVFFFPLLFLFLLPYISGFLVSAFNLIPDKISEYWHGPIQYDEQNAVCAEKKDHDYTEDYYDPTLIYDENYMPVGKKEDRESG